MLEFFICLFKGHEKVQKTGKHTQWQECERCGKKSRFAPYLEGMISV